MEILILTIIVAFFGSRNFIMEGISRNTIPMIGVQGEEELIDDSRNIARSGDFRSSFSNWMNLLSLPL